VRQNFHLFTRSTTPDNRRITVRYYHYPGHHHPDFQQHDAHGRPASRHSRPTTGRKDHRHDVNARFLHVGHPLLPVAFIISYVGAGGRFGRGKGWSKTG
jgi:hypothetical protein